VARPRVEAEEAMPRDRRNRYGDERVTLRQTLVIAVILHLMLGGILQWNPDLLWSDPVVTPAESSPLEFRFVDMPETETDETPDTDVMSDVDRVAADMAERDDAEDPFSEGNTPQEVLRSDPEPFLEPVPETPPSAVTPEASTEEAATSDERRAEETIAPPEANAAGPQPLATSAPLLPPPTRTTLRNSMLRGMQQFIEPEIFANSDGGVDGSQGLVSFDTKGYDLGVYINQVLRIIERNWKNNIPPAARWQGQEGAIFVDMSIVRDPETGVESAVINVTRSWSSGKPAFDQAALLALQISSPLPPLPEFFPYDQLDGRLGFLYNLDPSQVTFPSQR